MSEPAPPVYLGVFEIFETLEDPRVERTRHHPLMSVLIIALLATICGAEGWEDMEDFGLSKRAWLETFLDLREGIPSDDTFRRVLGALDPAGFNACFVAWVQGLAQTTAGKLIAIDGKTVRHSFNRATGKKALHLVSAWVAENHLTLGQVATKEKSNEITAIPKLIELLEIRGATITVDAMGCQRDIAGAIIDKGADYVMGLKGNQGTAHTEVEAFFEEARTRGFPSAEFSFDETIDGSEHGRLEVRRVWSSQDVAWFQDLHKWKGLRSLIRVERERTVGTETSKEVHYYWSSHATNAATFAKMIRGHWGIENRLHWCLDLAFREDDSRISADNGPENLALLRKIAMNLAKGEHTCKRGIKAKCKRAGWDESYLLTLLRTGLPKALPQALAAGPRG